MLSRPRSWRKFAAPETVKGTVSDVFASSKELGVAPSDGRRRQALQIKDQDIIYVNGDRHLLEDLDRDDVVEITTRSIRLRTKSFRRSMPRGPESLPAGNCGPATMRRGPSSWKRATKRITKT